MENKISGTPPPTEPSKAQLWPPVATPSDKETKLSVMRFEPSPGYDRRLVIEPAGGSYVYKVIDRKTGEVLWQYPLEEVLKRRSEESYDSGDIIRTSV
ncbi:MAG: hypothetical protein ACK5T5_02245 [Phenylobacterium sp.]|jgi:flagellar protein FlaG